MNTPTAAVFNLVVTIPLTILDNLMRCSTRAIPAKGLSRPAYRHKQPFCLTTRHTTWIKACSRRVYGHYHDHFSENHQPLSWVQARVFTWIVGCVSLSFSNNWLVRPKSANRRRHTAQVENIMKQRIEIYEAARAHNPRRMKETVTTSLNTIGV